MKKFIYSTTSFMILSAIVFACARENEQDLQKVNVGCNTGNIRFSTDIRPILENDCYACHVSSIASGGVVLDNYNGVKTVASNGRLVGALSHANGYIPMPPGRSKLSDCNLEKIKAWMNRGMINN